MSRDRESLVKEYLEQKGFVWGEPYDRKASLDDCNIYYINLYDPQFEKEAHAIICESSTTLHIQEHAEKLHEYGDEMEYNFSKEWTLHLLKDVPQERESVLLDINNNVKNITNEMNVKLKEKEHQIYVIKNEAALKIEYLQDIVDEYVEHTRQLDI